MAESKVLQLFLLISLMIFSTHALIVFLTDGKGTSESNSCFAFQTKVNVCDGHNGMRRYIGCAANDTYTAGPATTKVIVYITNRAILKTTILNDKCSDKRVELADALSAFNYELLYLGVCYHRQEQIGLLGEFLQQSIRPHQAQNTFEINTIGDGNFDINYETSTGFLTKYEETKNVLGWSVERQIISLHR